MKTCAIHDAGTIELYFYDELGSAERAQIDRHLRLCSACRDALAELNVIRTALAARPDVSSPPSGDWSAFMERLDASVRARPAAVAVPFQAPPALVRRSLSGFLAMAALLAIVAMGVFFASRAGRSALDPSHATPATAAADASQEALPINAGIASVSASHLERSKLVVLGLANREPGEDEPSDWAYERDLATSLLNDTRLYRMAAEQRGLSSLAGVMRDLELVLLQTAMAEDTDETALPQIQRLIRKRGLVEKMDVVGTVGLVP
ncbi:MAG TPA: zf-HC2 domain-containing protein [Vicinamibacterales bacterium]